MGPAFLRRGARARVVSTEDIEREDWTLNISRYVLPSVGEEVPPLPDALAAVKTALTDARSAEDPAVEGLRLDAGGLARNANGV